MHFILHIWQNSGNQCVPIWLKLGADTNKVHNYYNSHPSTKLIQYLTHGPKAMATRFDIFDRLGDWV